MHTKRVLFKSTNGATRMIAEEPITVHNDVTVSGQQYSLETRAV